MESISLEQLRYPIGKFKAPQEITSEHISEWIEVLETLPARLQYLVEHLTEEQLETPYRPNGWTVRQLVHHIADSHHNSYIRFKWALTENCPTIKAYDEKAWSDLFDARIAPIQMSLDHLKAVHAKLVYFLKGLSRNDLRRSFIHPEGNEKTYLDENIGRYAWHGSHHYAHIEELLKRQGWI
ncbi:bacillithiol transferase BstA [Flavobacteriaceae bacterium TP-CH-4]|uniref:Bacillithiol transferase BstA n=1 Tax=Pelagihabitans pacificus TaxID=2696054 RepID=A0A967E8U6_9FLAO|nr:bacillithiol transferase BstA [Pelagihabitans pacificus]NHF57886.1 bacillithiol transferase BstA [Pelagihabitans pacificus]